MAMSMGERIYLQRESAKRAMEKSARLAKEREEKKVVATRAKYVEDPSLSEKMVARLIQGHVHESFAARRKAVPRLPEIEESFNANDPRKHIGSEVLSEYQSMMQDSDFDQYGPRKLLIAAFMNKMEDSEEDIRKYVHKRRSSPFRTFSHEDFTTPPGQDEWESENRLPQHTSIGQSVLWGGGFGAAKEIGKKVLLKGAPERQIKNAVARRVIGRTLMQTRHPIAAAAGLAIAAIPIDFMIDFVDNKLGETDWGHKHPWLRLGASIGFLGITGRLTGKIVNRLQKVTKSKSAVEREVAKNPSAENLSELDDLTRQYDSATEELEHAVKGEYKTKIKAKSPKPSGEPVDVDEADDWLRRIMIQAEEKTPTARMKRREEFLTLEEQQRRVAEPYIDVSDASPEELVKTASEVPRARDVARPRYTKDVPTSESTLDVDGIIQKREATKSLTDRSIPKKNVVLSLEDRIGKDAAYSLRKTYGKSYVGGKKYSLADIEPDRLSLVEERVAKGTTQKQAIQEVGEMQATLKAVENAEKKRIPSSVVKDLRGLGYSTDDISRMDSESARAVVQGAENRGASNLVEKKVEQTLKTLEPKISKPVVKSTVKQSDVELEAWAKGLSPADRFDALQEGKIPQTLWKKITREERVKIESSKTYKEHADTEAMLDRAAMEQEGKELGSIVGNIVDGEPQKAIGRLEKIAVASAKRKVAKGGATELDEQIVQAAKEEEWNAVRTLVKAITAASVVVGVSSLFAPESAEAGKFDTAGRVVTKLVGDIIKKDPELLLRQSREAGLVYRPSGDPFILGERMKNIYVDPRNVKVSVDKELGLIGRAVGTPFAKLGYYFQGTSGMEQMNNPTVVLANGVTAMHVNTLNDGRIFRNIINAIPGYRNTSQEVAETMQPLMDKYFLKMQERGFYYQMRNVYGKKRAVLTKRLENAQRKLKKGKKVVVTEQGDAALKQYETMHKYYDDAYKAHEPMYNSYRDEWFKTVSSLAARKHNSGTRVFLAAEDTADYAKYPFLEGLLTYEEKVAAARIKIGMLKYATDVNEVGGKTISGPYMHHSMHPSASFKTVQEHMKKINPFTETPPPMTKIHSRSAGFLPMMPDAQYSINKYLPDINKRIVMRDFWRPGRSDGWEAFHQNVKDLPGLKNTFSEIKNAMRPEYREGFDKYAEKLYDMQVFQLLSGSPSVAFKHMLKEIVELRIFGLDGLKAYKQGVTSVSKLGLTQSGGMEALKKKGFSPNIWDEAVASHTEQGRLYRVISDVTPFKLNETQWDKFMGKLNTYGAVPVTAIERFGRGISVVAATKMAAKKGMTPAQATYSVYDTIVRTNFLSGPQNPAWIRDPKVRLMMMFQSTRFKIAETRLRLYAKGLKSVDRARLEVMNQLKADVKEGERRFHFDLMKQALLTERDIFGTPAVQQIMREIVLIGGLVGGGKYFFDSEFLGHIIHPPFFDLHGEDVAVSSSPIVQAVVGAGQTLADPEEDFIVSDFFKDWFGHASNGWPIPVNFMKAVRLTEHDIPKTYKDSSIRYFLGLPAEKERKLK